MYSTSTQKRQWTFECGQRVAAVREETNRSVKAKYASVVTAEEEERFLSVDEEMQLCNIVTDTGVRFSKGFRPSMWPSTRWSAFSYFKRFFLHHSPMEYSPKSIMMACFYLAAKVDEFNVSIHEFVKNLRSGTAESNTETILSLEPVVMLKLNYQLTVHCPFRPLEGHLLQLKTSGSSWSDVDLETRLRPAADKLLEKALIGDALLLYAPTHIALAALKQPLLDAGESGSLINDYVRNTLFGGENGEKAEEVIERLDRVMETIDRGAVPLPHQPSDQLQTRMQQWFDLRTTLDDRLLVASRSLEEPPSDDD